MRRGRRGGSKECLFFNLTSLGRIDVGLAIRVMLGLDDGAGGGEGWGVGGGGGGVNESYVIDSYKDNGMA